MSSKYILVADTNQYAGNFERELCAYITGQYGECSVGADIAKSEIEDYQIQNLNWWKENIVNEPDEYGTYRPVSIYKTEGYFNNGMGKIYEDKDPLYSKPKYPAYLSVAIFINEKPPVAVIKEFKERTHSFFDNEMTEKKKNFKIVGFRLIESLVVSKSNKI